ncbi:ESF1 homolog [Osmerus mordax]|uniref:ESF1 homolog n=1 Tax=Osmerus mordax TaxID=8014 RepID=UPI0035104CB4
MSLKREIDSPIIDFPPEKRVKSVGVQKSPREECLAFPSVKQEIVESPDPKCMSTKSNISMDKSFHKGENLPSIKGIKQEGKDNPMSSGRSVTSDKSKGTPLDSRARGTLPGTSAQAYTEPKDMVCDFCLNQKVSAVKTCLTCSCSYCEVHVRHHYTIPALQKHVLAEVSGDRGHMHQDQRGHMNRDQRGHMDKDQRGHMGTAGTPRTSRVSETVRLSQKYPKKKKSGLSELEMIQNRIKKLEKKNRKLKNISKIKSNLEKEVIQLKLEKDALKKENTKLKQKASFGSLLRNINMSSQECTGRACLQKERGSRTNPRDVDDYSQSGDGEGSEEDDSQSEDGREGFEEEYSRSEDLEASQDESEEGYLNEEENDYGDEDDDEDDDDGGSDEEASQGQNDCDDDDDNDDSGSDYEDDDYDLY